MGAVIALFSMTVFVGGISTGVGCRIVYSHLSSTRDQITYVSRHQILIIVVLYSAASLDNYSVVR